MLGLLEKLIAPQRLELKVGAQVMLVKVLFIVEPVSTHGKVKFYPRIWCKAY
jgi:hypothetical protein